MGKATKTADLNKEEHMDPRLMAGRPSWDSSRPLKVDVSEEASALYGASRSISIYPWPKKGLWEPIPHGGMLSQSGHMGEGLGPAKDDMTDFRDFPMEGLTLPGEQRTGWGRELVGNWGRRGGRDSRD